MRKRIVQVAPRVYNTLEYLDKPRWISLWHQITEVTQKKPKSILEIGVGNGLVSHILTMLGQKIVSIDIDRNLNPDYVGDVRSLPFASKHFDVILCAQVLEHIPYSDFTLALNELHRVCKQYVILTLPHDYLTYFLIHFKLFPYVKPISLFSILPRYQAHKFDGQHYWEIGKKGYPLQKIFADIGRSGFKIENTYCLFENPYHRFFVLRKEENDKNTK